jgi:acyl carrier protein
VGIDSKNNERPAHSSGDVSDQHANSQPISANEVTIQTWLIAKVAELVEIEPNSIDIRQPFVYYGMDSRQAAILAGDLEEWLGRRLSPSLPYDYPSIEALAQYLASGVSTTEPSSELSADRERC